MLCRELWNWELWLGVGGAGTGVYSGVSVLERVWVGEQGAGCQGYRGPIGMLR